MEFRQLVLIDLIGSSDSKRLDVLHVECQMLFKEVGDEHGQQTAWTRAPGASVLFLAHPLSELDMR
jgi:hypothetical protein